MATKPKLDLTLYLVTDSTADILGNKDICYVVEEAIKGGVSIVQYRDKHADTGELVNTAKRLHAITRKYGVPLLINDRIDVCLAAGAEGVHIGQDDMRIEDAKHALRENAIVGVTASSVEEAEAAINAGADYLGIGTMFATPTKKDTKSIIGTRGTQEILSRCKTGTEHIVGCVAIGSINSANVQRLLHQSTAENNKLNGVAVVSALMAANDPQSAAVELVNRIKSVSKVFYASVPPGSESVSETTEALTSQIQAIIKKHVSSSTLSHNMTNTVVQNFAANVCLATGASPIMSLNGAEAADLAKLGGGLVVNMGTITPDIMSAYQAGVQAYNAAGSPVLLDPVGGGATAVRRSAIQTLLKAGFFDVIKGNEGEISAVLGSIVQQRGVDSGPSSSNIQQKVDMVKTLARRERCLVLMTGATDYLSDGVRTAAIANGSYLLGKITGSGCALGSVIVSYLALQRGDDKLVAALAGILHYELAAERAERRSRGPGSFIPAFLDELYLLGRELEHGAYLQSVGSIKVEWL